MEKSTQSYIYCHLHYFFMTQLPYPNYKRIYFFDFQDTYDLENVGL